MQQLTPKGQSIISDLSQRYGFSQDAVTHMLIAVINGNGSMAQFSHPEFGGSGQWMQGGMMMLGDMFNHSLKNSVSNLCSEISRILMNEPGLLQTGSFQSQSQSGSGQQAQHNGAPQGQSSLFIPDPSRNWWPQDLGSPNATGSQNNAKYAYFANARRLAVQTNGQVWVYDTLDHQIGGFSQQQGSGGSILFSSQYGTVNLASLPVVSIDGRAQTQNKPAVSSNTYNTNQAPAQSNTNGNSNNTPNDQDIIASIEKLGALHGKGILTDEEFSRKKAELLERL